MQSVGSRLREAREKQGVSLDEIGARTRINARNLNAIEHDEVSDISSPFFYRSFVRQYAEQVGLDFQVLVPGVELLTGNMRQPDLPGQGEHEPLRVAPIQARTKRDYSWVVPMALFLGLVGLGSGGFAAWKYYKPTLQYSTVSRLIQSKASASPEITTSATAKSAASSGSAVPAPRATRTVTSNSDTPIEVPLAPVAEGGALTDVSKADPANAGVTNAVEEPKTSADTAVSDNSPVVTRDSGLTPEKIHVELAATERTWLSLSVDGKNAYTGILEPAETKIIDSLESAKVRTGNAGGVSITFNGRPLGVIGPRGKTRTVVFTKTGYEVQPAERVTPNPTTHLGG